jgi:Subtilisin inhibitor-like
MRASPVALAIAVTVTAVAAGAPTSAPTSLRITYWEDSAQPTESVTWTLRCDPASGSLARPVRACRKLAAGDVRLFAPTPRNAVCTEIYGGPQRARVVGTVNGQRIWATFTRTNGCEISRWQRLSRWLVPRGGVS